MVLAVLENGRYTDSQKLIVERIKQPEPWAEGIVDRAVMFAETVDVRVETDLPPDAWPMQEFWHHIYGKLEMLAISHAENDASDEMEGVVDSWRVRSGNYCFAVLSWLVAVPALIECFSPGFLPEKPLTSLFRICVASNIFVIGLMAWQWWSISKAKKAVTRISELRLQDYIRLSLAPPVSKVDYQKEGF